MKIRNGCPLVTPSSLEELLGGETSREGARAHQGALCPTEVWVSFFLEWEAEAQGNTRS